MRAGRGIVLVQALVSAVLIALVITGLMQMSLNRSMLLWRENAAIKARTIAEAAQARARSCLQALGWSCGAAPPADCTACGNPDCGRYFGDYTLTLPGSVQAWNVSVSIAGAPPSCRVEAVCRGCL